VARISVRADSAETAKGLARAIVNQLVQSNLLAPVAVLRPLDEQPVVAQTQPDWALGLGLALAAGAVAAVAVVSLRALLWPDTGQRVTRALTAAGVEHDVSAFGLGDGDLQTYPVGTQTKSQPSPITSTPDHAKPSAGALPPKRSTTTYTRYSKPVLRPPIESSLLPASRPPSDRFENSCS
jgi:hypothetical protein